MSVERVRLVRVPAPESGAELVTIVDTLEAFGIPCFVDDSGGGSRLMRGPVRKPPVVMVPQERLAAALELIRVHRRAPGCCPAHLAGQRARAPQTCGEVLVHDRTTALITAAAGPPTGTSRKAGYGY